MFSAAPVRAAEANLAVAVWFEGLSLPVPNRLNVIVCHGFGCLHRTQVALNEVDRVTLANMVRGATPEAERRGVARAVAWFDKRVGRQTGTSRAKAYARGLSGDSTQFDCVDRTTNTTSLLVVLEQGGLLHHHRVDQPTSRSIVPMLTGPHSTAVLTEKAKGAKWAIDPWPHNSGELPDVMPLERWVAKS